MLSGEKNGFTVFFFVVTRAVFNTFSTSRGKENVEQTSFSQKPFSTRFFSPAGRRFQYVFFSCAFPFSIRFFGGGRLNLVPVGQRRTVCNTCFFPRRRRFQYVFFPRRKRFQPVCNFSPWPFSARFFSVAKKTR